MPTSAPPWDQMAMAIEAWGIGIYEWQHAGGGFTASPRFLELYGLPPSTTEAWTAWTTVHPDDQAIDEQPVGYRISRRLG